MAVKALNESLMIGRWYGNVRTDKTLQRSRWVEESTVYIAVSRWSRIYPKGRNDGVGRVGVRENKNLKPLCSRVVGRIEHEGIIVVYQPEIIGSVNYYYCHIEIGLLL